MNESGTTFSQLGKKIKQARMACHMTQAELSSGIITRNMLSRIEHDAVLPSLPVLCALAERLSLSPGYFLDDEDDGNAERERRLLRMMTEAYESFQDELCLSYGACLDGYEDIRDGLMARSRYRLAKAALCGGELTTAEEALTALMSDPAAKKVLPMNEVILCRALAKGFVMAADTGKEEDLIISLREVAIGPHDLVTLSGLLTLIREGKGKEAKEMLSVSLFAELPYQALSRAVVLLADGATGDAKRQLLAAMSDTVPMPLICYCLTLLERCAVAERDYETAYGYQDRRRELVKRVKK